MSHSNYSPSARTRWSACPGSVNLIEKLDLPDMDTPYSLEGSAAHAIAAECLMNGTHPTDPDIAAYVDYVRGISESGVLDVERRLHDPANPDLYGTADAVIYDFVRLTIVDLKYGAGVDVQPGPQLEMYAVLAFAEGMNDVDEVALVIFQPRIDGEPLKQVVYPAAEVAVWRDAILAEIDACEVRDAPLHSGSHCQFCPAKAHCPELQRNTSLAAGMSHTLPDPQQLTDGQITWLLANRKRITDYLNSVEAFAMWRAQSGQAVPGWKVVQGLGHREWIDEKRALRELKKTGHKLGDLAPRKLLSPAQAEKLMLVSKETVAGLVRRPDGKPRLVPDSAPGEAVKLIDRFEDEK
jgi:hypothetical protein